MYGSSVNGPRSFGGVRPSMFDRDAARAERAEAKARRGQHPREYRGNHFANPDLVDVRGLVYNQERLKDANGVVRGTTGSFTWARILPTRDMNAPDQWAPPIAPDGSTGQWMFPIHVWRGGLTERITMIVQFPWEDDDVLQKNPAHMLRWNVWRLVESGAAPPWFGPFVSKKYGPVERPDDDPQGGRKIDRIPLPGTDWTIVVRAVVYAWGENYPNPPQGLGPDDKVTLLDLGTMASGALTREADEFGPVVGLAGGTFHCFYRSGDDPRKDERYRNLTPVGYEVFRAPEIWQGGPSPDLAAYESVLYPKLVPMSDVLYKPSRAAAAEILCGAFPQEILRAGWKGDAELLKVVDATHGPEVHPAAYYPQQPAYGQPPQGYGQPRQAAYGPPAQNYGPPAQNYGPPQQAAYGPPSQGYGPPQHQPPAATPAYGPPQGNHPPAPPAGNQPPQPPGPPQGGYGPPQHATIPAGYGGPPPSPPPGVYNQPSPPPAGPSAPFQPTAAPPQAPAPPPPPPPAGPAASLATPPAPTGAFDPMAEIRKAREEAERLQAAR